MTPPTTAQDFSIASLTAMIQCAVVCCGVLQCVTVCCSVLKYVAVCCSVLQCVAVCCSVLQSFAAFAVHCSVLQRAAVFCSVLQCVAVFGHISEQYSHDTCYTLYHFECHSIQISNPILIGLFSTKRGKRDLQNWIID